MTIAWAALRQAKTATLRHVEQTTADRERRITESFAKAGEQLGSDKLETRLVGIYTLERISGESQREYWPIMETLTAFVRERAPWPPRYQEPQEGAEPTRAQIRPAMDIQAVLTVLGRRGEMARLLDQLTERHLDLANTDLRGAQLGWAHLEGADLSGAHLEGAQLGGVVGLTQEQLEMTSGDVTTLLPDSLSRPSHWSKKPSYGARYDLGIGREIFVRDTSGDEQDNPRSSA